MYELRKYQTALVDGARDCYRQGYMSPLIVAPTGSGKTVCFAHIAAGAMSKNNSVWILNHRQELLKQTSRHLAEIGCPHTAVAAGRPFVPNSRIQVASVQTLVNRLPKLKPPSLLIIDEAHHAAAGSWQKIIQFCQGSHRLGVTATPERLDGKGLGVDCGGFFDVMIESISVQELISLGFLSPPVYYAPSILDLSKVHTRMGDYARGEVDELMTKNAIIGDVVKTYAKICPHTPAVAFCTSVESAEMTAKKFSAAGFPSLSLDGKLSDGERARRLKMLTNGDICVLTNCEIISEGFDLPKIGAVIQLRPTQSLSLHLQQIGRGLRPFPGKQCAYILDHVGNLMRHGLAEEKRVWTLAGRKSRGKNMTAPVMRNKRCPRCFAVHAVAPLCPQCGYKYILNPREIELIDGELVQVNREELAAQRVTRQQIQRARTLEDLQAIEQRGGYKRGWAMHIYNARNGKEMPKITPPEEGTLL